MAKIAKRLKEIRAAVDKTKQYDVVEGFKLLKDTAKAKQRLLATDGKANGAELNAAQTKSVRKVFG